MADKIKVIAGAGRRVPLDASVATIPGVDRLYLEHGTVIEVDRGNVHVQRAMADGDLFTATSEQIAAHDASEASKIATAAATANPPDLGAELAAATVDDADKASAPLPGVKPPRGAR